MERTDRLFTIRLVQSIEAEAKGRPAPLRDETGQVVSLPYAEAVNAAEAEFGGMWREFVTVSRD